MEVDLRGLFDSLRVPWRDRGKNVSAGNVNICCPWCRDDAGFHLSISEEGNGYYCYRSPQQHSGQNLTWVLKGLGVNRADAIRAINAHNMVLAAQRPREVEKRPPAAPLWERFEAAVESPRALEYLRKRGFEDAEHVARYYDLRYAPAGTWAGRVLLPIRQHGVVIGWTGRAWGALEPKYLAHNEFDGGAIYVPDEAAWAVPECIGTVQEGPLDALKVSWAARSEGLPVASAALTGKNFGPPKILRLKELARNCITFLVSLDGDAALSESLNTVQALRAAGVPAQRFKIPEAFKDTGEMGREEIINWLMGKL